MKKKNLNISLLNTLLKFNFLISEFSNNRHIRQNRLVIKQLNILTAKQTASFYLLDMNEIIKKIKQSIRLLQFLRKQKQRNLQLYFQQEFYKSLIEQSLPSFQSSKARISIKQEDKWFNFYRRDIVRAQYLFGSTKNVDYKYFHNNKLFLITEITKQFTFNSTGAYRIFSDLYDWKKIIFLTLIIKHTYIKNAQKTRI
jgi:hypothetical protein